MWLNKSSIYPSWNLEIVGCSGFNNLGREGIRFLDNRNHRPRRSGEREVDFSILQIFFRAIFAIILGRLTPYNQQSGRTTSKKCFEDVMVAMGIRASAHLEVAYLGD